MFTLLARLMVLLITTVSILCLSGGAAVYLHKMDYVTPRGGEKGKKTLNRVETARTEAKNLLVANQRALTRLSTELEPIVEVEGTIIERRDYYHAQLQMMRTGKWYGKDVAEPIQKLPGFDKDLEKYDKELITIHTDKEKAPTLESIKVLNKNADVPARPVSEYLEKIQTVNKDIEKKTLDTKKLIDDHAKLTIEIKGSEVPGMIVKGLRTRIREQIQIKEDADTQTEWLEEHVTRRQAEAELFVKRRDAMKDRLGELKAFFGIKDKPAVP